MNKANNDDLIRAVFTATDEAKTKALAILEGRASSLGETQDNAPLLLTMGEAAGLLNISRATLWRTIRAGRLQKVELYPGAFRLRRSDILAIVGSRPSSHIQPSTSRSSPSAGGSSC